MSPTSYRTAPPRVIERLASSRRDYSRSRGPGKPLFLRAFRLGGIGRRRRGCPRRSGLHGQIPGLFVLLPRQQERDLPLSGEAELLAGYALDGVGVGLEPGDVGVELADAGAGVLDVGGELGELLLAAAHGEVAVLAEDGGAGHGRDQDGEDEQGAVPVETPAAVQRGVGSAGPGGAVRGDGVGGEALRGTG